MARLRTSIQSPPRSLSGGAADAEWARQHLGSGMPQVGNPDGRGTPFRLSLAFLSSALAAVALPVFVVAEENFIERSVISLAVPASLTCGCLAFGLAKAVLREGWVRAGGLMVRPFGIVCFVTGGAGAAIMPQFWTGKTHIEGSPHLYTFGYAMVLCAVSALGAMCVSGVLSAKTSHAGEHGPNTFRVPLRLPSGLVFTRRDSPAWAPPALFLAGLGWLATATAALVDLRHRAGLRLLREQPDWLQGKGLEALLLTLPLVAAWTLATASSLAAGSPRRRGAVLALGLSAGGVATALLILVRSALPLGPRAPGPADALAPFVIAALLPQLLALAAGARLLHASPAEAPCRSRSLLALGSVTAAASLATNAALGLHSFHRCVGTESAARAAIYEIRSVEDEYRHSSGGRFASIRCLVAPSECPEVARRPGLQWLSESWLQPVRCGYRFTFHAGAPASGHEMEAFAVTAIPLQAGSGRGFCTDGSTVVRYSENGQIPKPIAGRCSEELQVLP